ncbi:MAG TPA: hydrogenase expression/formation protein HypE [Bryobacteraceae bacterium]|nr:hydrogenase expression/formation protein HypE [Bryobacteraceae bacterium]
MSTSFTLSCPLPVTEHKTIVLGHGSGGRLTAQLVREVFLPAFDNPALRKLDDQAVLDVAPGRIALTTDSYVVTPLFFPGGDIGHLAVNGTVNDLAMSGARPLYLTAAFIIEEGLPMEDLQRVAQSMAQAAAEAGVAIVTGDTKVVNRGCADKLFITTAGVGVVADGASISASNARAGDVVIVSGPIGDHGITIWSTREGIDLAGSLQSDTAPLHTLVEAMVAAGDVHVLRDPTRGGLGTSLCEVAASSSIGIELDANAVPVRDEVKAACEILGMDPLFVANEGRLVAMVAESSAESVLQSMRRVAQGRDACRIGRVVADHAGMVLVKTEIGGSRILDVPFAEQLPRIC